MNDRTLKLPIVENDPWLKPVEAAMVDRYLYYQKKLTEIENVTGSIVNYANGYLYFGFQYDVYRKGWWFREWLPGAKDVYLFGEFNDWQRTQLRLDKDDNGTWSIFLPDEEYAGRLVHGSLVKMLVHGDNGFHERIPAYIRRAVQDDITKDFTGQFWAPAERFDWTGDDFDIASVGSLLIYECHVGMATEAEGVGTYLQFAKNVLPRIKKDGYNTIQLMAVAEHPYYGSFGYHVSNFYAPSSRFGTPEELKTLIKTAHNMGIAVIIDIVHSHYVNNFNEGLNQLDGTDNLYSPAGTAGDHPFWGSKLFDYRKEGVQHFLLSNLKYWMDEFHFDGFRFDGVTSMIYYHHGLTEFDSREKYFTQVNGSGLAYLTLANKLVHEFRPSAVTISEDVSGMPGMCLPIADGGVGFDYRLGMSLPDFWIKLIEEVPDEEWDIYEMWSQATNRLGNVKTVAYCESHDQAMVGDQTLAFRLMDTEMYYHMDRTSESVVVDRAMALHKMIRLFTISLAGEAYLNFMGNEFGHPEWIDFPREGNNWSYAHARRQWSLSTDGFLRYSFLGKFDRAMIALVKKYNVLGRGFAYNLHMDYNNKTVVFSKDDLLFIFNWHPQASIPDYILPVREPGRYKILLSTDEKRFGGYDRIDKKQYAFSFPVTDEQGNMRHYLQVYNVSRAALVLLRLKT